MLSASITCNRFLIAFTSRATIVIQHIAVWAVDCADRWADRFIACTSLATIIIQNMAMWAEECAEYLWATTIIAATSWATLAVMDGEIHSRCATKTWCCTHWPSAIWINGDAIALWRSQSQTWRPHQCRRLGDHSCLQKLPM